MHDFLFEKNRFLPAIRIELSFSSERRRILAAATTAGIILFFIAILYSAVVASLSELPSLYISGKQLLGILFLFASVRISVFALERYVRSLTFDTSGDASSSNIAERLNYCASVLWFCAQTEGQGKLQFFFSIPKSSMGAEILMRLGISPQAYILFLQTYRQKNNVSFDDATLLSSIELEEKKEITSADIMTMLFRNDADFRDFIIVNQADEPLLRGTALWVEQRVARQKCEERWWSREKLGRVPGLAKTWSYGPVFTLMKYAARVSDEVATLAPVANIGRENELRLIEDALLSSANANVVLVGDPGAGKETLILALNQLILQGKVFPELESKRIFRLSGPALVASGKSKGETEAILIHMLNEAAAAGDVILVIEQFPEFVDSLANLGVIAEQILEPYLASNSIHIIAMADTTPFRRVIESNAALMAHFEKIEIVAPDEARLGEILQEVASRLEALARGSIIITYPALKKIAEAGVRYLVEGALPERAITFMQELITHAATRKEIFIRPELVAEYIGKKTKMPLGAISKDEQKKLMNLEDRLHERVVNQVEAINAIATTIRRSRAGIGEPKRPIGSFLFLGPTGVGKTETAKTLAAVYFGNEDALIRFDMTEYQTEDAIARLIGSFETNEPGILASRMRSSPYGTVLLDEFEKADKKVIDLFLQILDEGFFTDAFGAQINMRNTIIIATSNAGSKLIWQWVGTGINPTTKKSELIAAIQEEGKFKPELLNRFDSIIIYQPLTREHLKQVARLMIQKLAQRLQTQQSITLEITDELLDETVRQGYDPIFGARPMRRFIQDNIEKIIAEKIIKGEISRGGSVILSAGNLK